MSTLCHSLCKHARSILWQQPLPSQYIDEKRWLADISIIIVRLRVSPDYVFVFFFFGLLFCFHSFIPMPLNYLCDALRTFEHSDTAIASSFFLFSRSSFICAIVGRRVHFRYNGFALVHLWWIYIKSTYIINFRPFFYFQMSKEKRERKERNNKMCHSVWTNQQ